MLGVALVDGDLDDITALQQLVAECDAVVHCAGAVRGNSQADFDRVNVVGTCALLQVILAQTRPPVLLMLSSLAAREPHLSWYARSKREGEKLAQALPELNAIILRPPAVYGPGDKEMQPIFEWMKRGIALVPGSAEARTSLIHVSDLVTAMVSCLNNSAAASGNTMTLCDGQANGYSWREMAAIASEHWGRNVRLFHIPGWLLDTVAALNSRAAAISGRAPMLTPPKVRELRHDNWVVDNQAITKATGWTPRVTLRTGLQQL
jgi:nucleoside-diphosphate-sugar epimerase